MNDKGNIIAGLVVFVVLVTFPIWYGIVFGGDVAAPELELPAEGSCIHENMAARHMDLLDEWRDLVVRDGRREYRGDDQKKYEMSLTNTCLAQCHAGREAFCDACHNYASVEPTCWACHVE